MKSMRNTLVGLSAAGLLATSASSFADTVTWNGGDGEYTVGANWTPANVPDTNAGDTAVIDSGAVTYTAGGDLHIHNGGTLQINGGSWTQAGGIAWIQLAGGNLVVAGGTFNQGTAGNIVRDASSSITISSGAANFAGEFANSGTLSISGGTVVIPNNFVATAGTVSITGGTIDVGGELKPQGADFTINGGTLNASLISFDAVAASFNIGGGTINLSGNFTEGVFANSPDAFVNFTGGSTGQLHLSSVSTTAAANLLSGRVRLDGVVSIEAFEILSDGEAGSIIQLVGVAIPEPSAFAAAAGVAGLLVAGLRRRRRGA